MICFTQRCLNLYRADCVPRANANRIDIYTDMDGVLPLASISRRMKGMWRRARALLLLENTLRNGGFSGRQAQKRSANEAHDNKRPPPERGASHSEWGPLGREMSFWLGVI